MEGSVVSEVNDGPVLNLIYKRLRALKKKYNRIIQMEKALSQGKTLNEEQEEVLRSKPGVVILIDEYEKLRQPLSVAIQEELHQYHQNLESAKPGVAIQQELNQNNHNQEESAYKPGVANQEELNQNHNQVAVQEQELYQNHNKESAIEVLRNREKNYKPLPLPSKQEWLESWYQDGKLNWWAPGRNGHFMHKIFVAPLFTKTQGGFGIVFSNFGCKPIVAATGTSLTGPVSLHFHELQGVRAALECLLKYKSVFNRIGETSLEIRCTSRVLWEVLNDVADTVRHRAEERSSCMDRIKYSFSCASVYISRSGTKVIQDIFNLFKELHEFENKCDFNITYGLGLGIQAAYFMAGRSSFSSYKKRVQGLEMDSVAVEELRPDQFPEELKEILYQAAMHRPINYWMS